MDRVSLARLLEGAIEAAEAGHHERARSALLQVLEADPEHEPAWLWLSRLVGDEQESRACLENVLALNPQNEAARQALAELDTRARSSRRTHRRVLVSPAAAMLHPGRKQIEWTGDDRIELRRVAAVGYSSHSAYDDVWEREAEICAYCATELEPEATRCPGCGRHLLSTTFRYEKPSSDLFVYFVLVLGVAQVSLALVLVDLLSLGSPAVLAWNTLVVIGMAAAAVGVYARRFWGYLGSIIGLLLVLTAMIVDLVTEGRLQGAGRVLLLEGLVDLLTIEPIRLVAPLGSLLPPLQLLVTVFALLLGLLRVGPEFERVKERRVAELARGLREADEFYARGRSLAQRQMWASAVLHWRRAAALEPARTFYQQELGLAYARLGFYRRGADVLESALQLTGDAERRVAIMDALEQLKALVPGEEHGAGEHQAAAVTR
jgi:tetratricopeptide (TPR) repeat protein